MADTLTKLYSRAFFFSLSILILWLILFFLSTLRYCLYMYKLKLEENEPIINGLPGIKNFSFSNTTSNNPECIPGVEKERNITLIKKLMEDYELNKTTNNNINNYKTGMKIIYFFGLPSYIIITIFFIILTVLIKLRKFMDYYPCILTYTYILSFLIFIADFNNLSINSELLEIYKSNFKQNTFKLFIGLGTAIFWMHILLTILFIIFNIYLCCLDKKDTTANRPKGENNYKSLEDKNTTEIKNKDNSSDVTPSPYDDFKKNSDDKTYPLTPEGIN